MGRTTVIAPVWTVRGAGIHGAATAGTCRSPIALHRPVGVPAKRDRLDRRRTFPSMPSPADTCVIGVRHFGTTNYGRETIRRACHPARGPGPAVRARALCRRYRAARCAARLLRAQPARARKDPLDPKRHRARYAGRPRCADRRATCRHRCASAFRLCRPTRR